MFEGLQQHERRFVGRYRLMQWSTFIGALVALGWVWIGGASSVGNRDALERRARQAAQASPAREGPILDEAGRELVRSVEGDDGRWQREFPYGSTSAAVLLGGPLVAEQRAVGYRSNNLATILYGSPAWVVTRPPLRTTLNAPFSADVQRLLAEEGVPGSVICCRPDGRIIALVDAPSVDPARYLYDSQYRREINARNDAPLFSRSLSIQPVGSVMKPLVAAILLEQGKLSHGFAIHCNGRFVLNGKTYYCSRRAGHGRVTIQKALAVSCNCFFWAGVGYLDQQEAASYFHQVGLLSPNVHGLSTPPAVMPVPGAPPETWRMNVVGLYCQLPLLGLAQSYICLLDGQRHQLRILADEPSDVETVFGKASTALVRQGLNDAAWFGTATAVRAGRAARWRPCGKTGTTGSSEPGPGSDSLFVGFAPGPDNPQILVVVFLEGGGGGGRAAALAGRVMDTWFEKYAYASPTARPGAAPSSRVK